MTRPPAARELRCDESLTIRGLVTDGGIRFASPVVRRTEHRSTPSRLRRQLETRELPASDRWEGEVGAALEAQASAVAPELVGRRLALRAERLHRTVEAARGPSFTFERSWVELLLVGDDGAPLATDGTFELRAVADHAHRLAAAAESPPLPTSARVRSREDLVLHPDVAGLVLHELVGHGAEVAPDVVDLGLRGLHADAVLLPARPCDDSGVPHRPVPVLEDGWLRPVRSGRAGPDRLSGLFQVAAHAPHGSIRCAALSVRVGRTAGWPRQGRHVECRRAARAMRTGDAVIVQVSAAVQVVDGEAIARVAPFVFALPLHRPLGRADLLGEPRDGPIGTCTTPLGSLPSQVAAPPLALTDVGCVPLAAPA